MKKLLLLAIPLIMVGCNERLGGKTDMFVNDGHDYQWVIIYSKPYIVHSPECDSCKAMRKQEIKELIEELKKKDRL